MFEMEKSVSEERAPKRIKQDVSELVSRARQLGEAKDHDADAAKAAWQAAILASPQAIVLVLIP